MHICTPNPNFKQWNALNNQKNIPIINYKFKIDTIQSIIYRTKNKLVQRYHFSFYNSEDKFQSEIKKYKKRKKNKLRSNID